MGFNQGLSGLNSAARNLDVIGNNIANTSTVGFKASRTEFSDVYAASLYGLSSLTVGIGSKVSAITQQFTQGNISVTNNPLDLAISGDGFFQLDQNGLATYARNGQFQMDKEGFIVDSAGRKLTGNLATVAGVVVPGPPVPLQVSLGVAPPSATSLAEMVANLDSTSTDLTAGAIVPGDPTTYNYSTTFTVYDGAGTAQGLSLYFRKTAPDTWDVDGYIGDPTVPANQVGLNGAAPSTAILVFDPATGTLDAATGINGAAPALIADIDGVGTLDLDITGMTQYGTTSGVSFVTQDGYSAGQFASLSLDKTGQLQGRYTNGQILILGQVLMTNFLNPNGLQPLGDNQWAETSAAGKQNSGAPGSGVLGYLQSGAVEDSNVDLTAELVNMIVAQRMYQANAQTVKTQDQVLQTLVNLR